MAAYNYLFMEAKAAHSTESAAYATTIWYYCSPEYYTIDLKEFI